MRRRVLILAVALGTLALAVPASGGFGPAQLDNDFEGRVERDRTTYFGFDVLKKRGKQKVAKVTALLRYSCDGGKAGPARARVRGKLRVNDERFGGTLRRTADFGKARGLVARGGSPGKIKYRVRGKFVSKRKAKGSIDAEIRFRAAPPTRGVKFIRCYSGEVAWKAKRGADVEPVVPMRSGS
jgi:hypothetical protein